MGADWVIFVLGLLVTSLVALAVYQTEQAEVRREAREEVSTATPPPVPSPSSTTTTTT